MSALLEGAELRGVLAVPGSHEGREALRVRLAPAVAAGLPGVDYVDQPTFVLLPIEFDRGVIEVDVAGSLLDDAPDYARGFAGLAFHVTDDAFESVYLRPTNGLRASPPPPRDQRALQYFAYPEHPFDRLRDERPGVYEAAADIGEGSWHRLRVEVAADAVTASVDGAVVLRAAPLLPAARGGRIGLWVDIGTTACFADLVVEAARETARSLRTRR